MSGANTYTGGTTVNNATLYVDGGAVEEGVWTSTMRDGVSYTSGGFMGATAPRAPITPIPKGPVFYIITEGAGLGDSVRTVPCTGKETVLSAIGAVGGISQVSGARIWIARPSPGNGNTGTMLSVDWEAISKRGNNASNYTLMPGDRLVFGQEPAATQNNMIGKKTAPIERANGIVALTTSTLRGVQNTPGAGMMVRQLLQEGVFDGNGEVKKLVLEMLRVSEQESKKAGEKQGQTPKAEHSAEKPNAPTGYLYTGYSGEGTMSAVLPHELAMKPLPDYRIEPPDVISVEMLKLVPRPPYRAAVFDVFHVKATAPQNAPIDKDYMIDAEGNIDFGQNYGSVKVVGKTKDEIRAILEKWLRQYLNDPNPNVQLVRAAARSP